MGWQRDKYSKIVANIMARLSSFYFKLFQGNHIDYDQFPTAAQRSGITGV
jgi:hypothetical protein